MKTLYLVIIILIIVGIVWFVVSGNNTSNNELTNSDLLIRCEEQGGVYRPNELGERECLLPDGTPIGI